MPRGAPLPVTMLPGNEAGDTCAQREHADGGGVFPAHQRPALATRAANLSADSKPTRALHAALLAIGAEEEIVAYSPNRPECLSSAWIGRLVRDDVGLEQRSP